MTATSSQRLRIALLGCGLMGLPMARRLLAAGHELHIWNRTRSKAEPLAVEGAHVHDSPRLACLHADYVISMLETARSSVKCCLAWVRMLPSRACAQTCW